MSPPPLQLGRAARGISSSLCLGDGRGAWPSLSHTPSCSPEADVAATSLMALSETAAGDSTAQTQGAWVPGDSGGDVPRQPGGGTAGRHHYAELRYLPPHLHVIPSNRGNAKI